MNEEFLTEVTEEIKNANDVDDTPVEPVVTENVPDTVVENETEAPTGFAVGVVTGCLQLAVRKEAKPDADVVRVVNTNAKVTVDLGKSTDDWYRVSTETGIGGFCMKKFVTVK